MLSLNTRAYLQAAERGIEICQSLIDLAKIEQAPKGDSSLAARDVKICYECVVLAALSALGWPP
jgi:hypothetical protein